MRKSKQAATILVALAMGILGCGKAPTMDERGNGAERRDWAIALHGGAGTIGRGGSEQIAAEYRVALAVALEVGVRILNDGGTSLDAVEAVVRHLEDSPLFNAGKGAAITRDGEHQMDAAIMDGATLDNGAVAAVRFVRNPVSLARHVMTSTPHALISGPGAEQLAEQAGVRTEPSEYFRTPMRYERWLRMKQREAVSSEAGEIEKGTVGAVALDRHGNLAAATSTGGLTNKLSGRIGDSPLIGIGTYANNATLAISCTGHGEEFIRRTAAFRVSALMEYGGLGVGDALAEVVHKQLAPDSGGAVAVDSHGTIAMDYSTRGMYRGAADSTGRFEVAIWEE